MTDDAVDITQACGGFIHADARRLGRLCNLPVEREEFCVRFARSLRTHFCTVTFQKVLHFATYHTAFTVFQLAEAAVHLIHA